MFFAALPAAGQGPDPREVIRARIAILFADADQVSVVGRARASVSGGRPSIQFPEGAVYLESDFENLTALGAAEARLMGFKAGERVRVAVDLRFASHAFVTPTPVPPPPPPPPPSLGTARVIQAHDDSGSMALTRTGLIVSSGGDAKVWSLPNAAPVLTLMDRKGKPVPCGRSATAPDGTLLACASGAKQTEQVIAVWSLAEKRPIVTLGGHTDFIRAMAFAPDGTWLASAAQDYSVKLWSLPSGAPLASLAVDARGLAITSDSKSLVTGGSGPITIWSIPEGKKVRSLQSAALGDVYSLALSDDGALLAAGTMEKKVTVFSFPDLVERATFEGHSDWVTAVALSPDAKWVASADGDVRLWSIAERRLMGVGRASRVVNLAFTPDGDTLIARDGGRLSLWSLKELRAGNESAAEKTNVAFK